MKCLEILMSENECIFMKLLRFTGIDIVEVRMVHLSGQHNLLWLLASSILVSGMQQLLQPREGILTLYFN